MMHFSAVAFVCTLIISLLDSNCSGALSLASKDKQAFTTEEEGFNNIHHGHHDHKANAQVVQLRKCCSPHEAVWDHKRQTCITERSQFDDDKGKEEEQISIVDVLDAFEKIPDYIEVQVESHQIECDKDVQSDKFLLNSETSFDFLMDFTSHDDENVAFLYDVNADEYVTNYCVEKLLRGNEIIGISAHICRANEVSACGKEYPCRRLCCPRHHIFSETSGQCTLIEAHNHTDSYEENFKFFYKAPECQLSRIDGNEISHKFDSGNIEYSGRNYSMQEHCFSDASDSAALFICKKDFSENQTIQSKVASFIHYIYCSSAIFLIFTIIVIRSRKQHKDKLFGFLTISMMVTLTLFYLMISILHFVGMDHLEKYPLMCKIHGFLLQYLYLSSLFWLNSMSLVIWKNFRNIQKCQVDPLLSWKKDRRIFYHIAWALGGPLVITGFTLAFHIHENVLKKTIIVPGIGTESCFLSESAMFWYLHLFSSLIILCNCCIFCYAACSLCSNQRHSEVNSNRHVVTGLKLFIVMGLLWLAEITSWAVGQMTMGKSNRTSASVTFDLINAGQGILIFFAILFDEAMVTRIKRWITCGQSSHQEFQARYRKRPSSWVSEQSCHDRTEETMTTMTTQSTTSTEQSSSVEFPKFATTIKSSLTSPVRKTYIYELHVH